MTDQQRRETEVTALAEELHFQLEKRNSRFSLRRELPDEEQVRREDLTLDEAEQFLNRWKLRGLGGG